MYADLEMIERQRYYILHVTHMASKNISAKVQARSLSLSLSLLHMIKAHLTVADIGFKPHILLTYISKQLMVTMVTIVNGKNTVKQCLVWFDITSYTTH